MSLHAFPMKFRLCNHEAFFISKRSPLCSLCNASLICVLCFLSYIVLLHSWILENVAFHFCEFFKCLTCPWTKRIGWVLVWNSNIRFIQIGSRKSFIILQFGEGVDFCESCSTTIGCQLDKFCRGNETTLITRKNKGVSFFIQRLKQHLIVLL